jgi:two-component system response regulator FlrC
MTSTATCLRIPAQPNREAEPVALSAAMRAVLEAADDVAATRTTVLLLGESGTGKEVLARYLHRRSERAQGPWVAVNCAALPEHLLESELFGHERGAFTGASERRIGKLEQASGGTILLDEISEMPMVLQAKLLRALQEREVDRVGGARPVPVDVRVIATSNRDLASMVAAGTFRQDLYYRLDVYPLHLPPLRERREDMPVLCADLLERLSAAHGRPAPLLDPSAQRALQGAELRGNVRELGNLLERALVRCRGGAITAALLGLDGAPAAVRAVTPVPLPVTPGARFPPGVPISLPELEKLAIAEALRRTQGNRTHAATLLGIGLRTLRNKLNGGNADVARIPQGQDT